MGTLGLLGAGASCCALLAAAFFAFAFSFLRRFFAALVAWAIICAGSCALFSAAKLFCILSVHYTTERSGICQLASGMKRLLRTSAIVCNYMALFVQDAFRGTVHSDAGLGAATPQRPRHTCATASMHPSTFGEVQLQRMRTRT